MSGEAAPLGRAAEELRFLLSRGYPQEASLALVGNRHDLDAASRDILRRAVVAPETAAARRAKLLPLAALRGRRAAVDGHNQLLTLESALRGGPLVAADDGVVRDIARAAPLYRPTAVTEEALSLLLEVLVAAGPQSVLFLFDAPVSHSGELSARVRALLAEAGLEGEARTAAYPEAELERHRGPVATADGGLIERCEEVVDLAGEVIRARPPLARLLVSLGARG